jgi:hypothetical protein
MHVDTLLKLGGGGSCHVLVWECKTSSKGMNDMTQFQGGLQFINFSEEVLELEQVVRQAEDQVF